MKLAALAIAFLLPVAAFAPASRPDVGFATAANQAGAKQAVALTHDLKMTMVVSMGGQELQKMELPQRATVACDVKFDKADAAAATIVFGDCNETKPNPFGAAKAEPTSYAQKCYLAKPGAAGYEVKPDAGEGELADEDKKAADMMVVHLVGPAPLAPLLAGKTLKKGDKIAVPADVAQKCFGLFADEAKVSELTLVLAEEPAAGDAIVFQATAKMALPASEEMPAEMTMEPAGTWSVSKSTCRVAAMAMKGPVKMRGTVDQGGMKMEMKADGEWTLAWSVAAK